MQNIVDSKNINKKINPKINPNIKSNKNSNVRAKAKPKPSITPRKNSNPPRRITSQINSAKSLNNEEYKKKVTQSSIKSENLRSNSKDIKGPKKLNHIKMRIAAMLLASSAVVGPIVGNEINEFKNEQAERSLSILKEELGADEIYNNSTMLSSNSSKTEYSVIKNGATYTYLAYNNDGSINVKENSIGDSELINAISIVTNADGGSIFDAINAKRLADEIESGKEFEIKMYKEDEEKDEGFEPGE